MAAGGTNVVQLSEFLDHSVQREHQGQRTGEGCFPLEKQDADDTSQEEMDARQPLSTPPVAPLCFLEPHTT